MSDAPSRKRLLGWTLAALAGASLVTTFVVLPAEYGVDPTGFGRLTGLTRMGASREVAVAPPKRAGAVTIDAARPWRSDTLTIRLETGGQEGSDTERKVWMVPGQAFVYAWTSDGEVYSDFHGETLPSPRIQVMTYRTTDPLKGEPARGLSGAFTAPMEGFHGWYFRNLEGRPVTVTVRLAGFYELRPYPPPGVTPKGH
ncbi:hypothetical protein ACFODL_17220 [Phenylobacterium terrae]|uniref:Transmembrane anchor protein n=1 Tax=Phenylobacterium terrae TaxID=2665495 RepID=A0ABW4N2S4_9CAUL